MADKIDSRCNRSSITQQSIIPELPIEAVSYRLSKTKGGSDRYGACECCGGDANTTYLLTRFKTYARPDDTKGQLFIGQIYGHKQCLSQTTFYCEK